MAGLAPTIIPIALLIIIILATILLLLKMPDSAPTIIPIALSIITILETILLKNKVLNRSSHYDDIYKISGIICAVCVCLMGLITIDNGGSLPTYLSVSVILGLLTICFFLSLTLFMSSLLLKKIQNKSKSTTILATICLTSLGLMVTSIVYFGISIYLDKKDYTSSEFLKRFLVISSAWNLLMVIASGLATVDSILIDQLQNSQITQQGVVCISILIVMVSILLFYIIYKFIDKKF